MADRTEQYNSEIQNNIPSLTAEIGSRSFPVPTELGELGDVNLTNPQNNQTLKYNSSTQKGENGNDIRASWGNITGTIDDQTDLKNALNTQTKLNKDAIGWSGKQLLPLTLDVLKQSTLTAGGTWSGNTYTKNGVAFDCSFNKDGYLTEIDADGTATGGDAQLQCFNRVQNPFNIKVGQYIGSGCPSQTGDNYKIAYPETSGSTYISHNDTGAGCDINISADTAIGVVITINNGKTVSHKKFYPMLRYASVSDDTFEPYHESVEECKFDRAEQRVLGAKNLLPYPYGSGNSLTSGGVSYSVDDDGVVTASDSSTGESTFFIEGTNWGYANYIDAEKILKPNTEYTLSAGIENSNNIYIHAVLTESSGTNLVAWRTISDADKTQRTPADLTGVRLACWIRIKANITISTPIKIYPMLRLASDPDDTYVPFAKTNKQLTDELTPSESSITTTQTMTDGYNLLTKWGKIVQTNLRFKTVTGSSGDSLGTIPTGFRPLKDMYVPARASASGNIWLQISSGGGVSLTSSVSSENIQLHTVWITA